MPDYSAVQDTAGVNYNTHQKTEETGISATKRGEQRSQLPGGNLRRAGFFWGGLEQRGYNREEAKDESAGHDRKKAWPIEAKESFRWRRLKSGETLERSTADLPPDIKMITVCDREGDMADCGRQGGFIMC
jgi:hypothetical protein